MKTSLGIASITQLSCKKLNIPGRTYSGEESKLFHKKIFRTLTSIGAFVTVNNNFTKQ